ncbi:MAG: uroporphyrinogen decarboxylase family protein [Bacillota bacterium]|nr:uroporphyrinogen decarboxylase family protein [Bacillota bacterium]
MTGRERLLAVLRGEIPDRVPVSFFIQEEFLAYYYPNKEKVDRVKDAVECGQYFGLDIMPRSREFEYPHFLKRSYPNWELNQEHKKDNDNFWQITTIKTPKGELKQVKVAPYDKRAGHGLHFSTKEYLIENARDFEIFSEYVPELDAATRGAMREYAVYINKVVGDIGLAAPWGWSGVYNQAAEYRNLEKLLIDVYMDKEFYDAYMEKLTAMMVNYNQAYADTALDCIGLQGNIANSSVIGADYFDEHILPYEQRLVSAIKDTGAYTLYHNCGKAKVLQQSYVKMGIDIWETVAEAPFGDNTLKEAKAAVGDKLILSGNLDQVSFLKTANLKEVENKVIEIVQTGKPGGKYIFAASDFLEKDTPIENIKKAIEVAKREGKY